MGCAAGCRGLRSAAEQPRSRSTMNSSRRNQRGWPSGFAKASPDNQAKPRHPFGGPSLSLSLFFDCQKASHGLTAVMTVVLTKNPRALRAQSLPLPTTGSLCARIRHAWNIRPGSKRRQAHRRPGNPLCKSFSIPFAFSLANAQPCASNRYH